MVHLISLKKTIILINCLFIFQHISYAQSNANFSITESKYKIDLINYSKKISFNANIFIEKKILVDSIHFDLLTQYNSNNKIQIDSVLCNDKLIDWDEYLGKVIVPNCDINNALRYSFFYHGIPIDGLIISQNKYRKPTIFADNWPNRARYWLINIDKPSNKSKYKFEIKTPKDMQAISNGILNFIDESNPEYNLFVWSTKFPIPTKVAVIGVASFQIDTISNNSILNTAWVYPDNSANALNDLRISVDIIQYFEKFLGAFPFEKIAHVESTTKYGGMENASCIFYSQNAFNGNGNSQMLIAHEIAHQWFGNSVSEIDYRHLWISEGFATYLSYLFIEHKYGIKEFNDELLKGKNQIEKFHQKYPNVTMVPDKLDDASFMLNPYSYQKGAWLLHEIRKRLGVKKFWSILKSFHNKRKYKNASSNDFLNHIKKETGESFDELFNVYLYSPNIPFNRYKKAV